MHKPRNAPHVGRAKVVAFLKKNPDMPNHTAAKKLARKYPNTFSSVEQARSLVRHARGANGVKTRERAARIPTGVEKPLGWKRPMPKSRIKRLPLVRIDKPGRILILSDIHLPYHDAVAVEVALKHAEKWKPHSIILNGDTMDFYSISRYQTDPDKRDLKGEIQVGRDFLAHLRERFPDARILFKWGNHEDRWAAYIANHASDLADCDFTQLREILEFEESGIEEVQSRQFIKVGKLLVVHGHELPKGIATPVCAAKRLFDRLRASSVAGHWHQISEFTDNSGYDKRMVSCWTVGTLGDLAPDYAPLNNWSAGFGEVELVEGGEFVFENRRIIKGKLY